MNVDIDIPDQLINDTIISAVEGGINYWISGIRFFNKDGEQIVGVTENPLENLSSITIVEAEGENGETEHTLHLSKTKFQEKPQQIYDGLQRMAKQYPRHFADMISENGDATTADVFIQCCVLGEITYG